MTKRKNSETAELRAALQPGAVFETKAGTFGRVISREVTADGVMLRCAHVCKSHVRTNKSELREQAMRIARLATQADYDAAVALANSARPAKAPKASPAATSLRDLVARIEALEAQVAELTKPRNALQVVR